MSNKICITSRKPENGATTTTVNLAASLAAIEKRTLLIDFDSEFHASQYMGIDIEKFKYDIGNIITKKDKLINIASNEQLKFLKILPVYLKITDEEAELPLNRSSQEILSILLKMIPDDNFDYIILDMPSSKGFLKDCGIGGSDWLVITLNYKADILFELNEMLNEVIFIKNKNKASLKIAGILLNKYNNGEISDILPDEIMNTFKNIIFSSKIPLDNHLDNSTNDMIPACMSDIKSKGAEAYLNLAVEIINLIEN